MGDYGGRWGNINKRGPAPFARLWCRFKGHMPRLVIDKWNVWHQVCVRCWSYL